MYATYHLASAIEVNADFLEAAKAACKSKPITIAVEEIKILSYFRKKRNPQNRPRI